MFETNLNKICEQYGFDLEKRQQAALKQFFELMLEANEKINLTAIVEPNEIILKHFIDSFMVEKKIKFDQNAKLLDVGAGAGFPSVPVAILRPDLKITQLDCLNKRVNFLKQVAKLLELKTEVIHGRAEELGKNEAFREHYDFVVARAVAPLNRLLEYCLPFVKVGGLFVALKGKNFEIEMENAKNAVKELGGLFERVETFNLDEMKRALILIRKNKHTPKKYPRMNSKILKSVL